MSAEDDPARTIVPRLTAAGADLAKVHILESVILANGSETLPSLRADIDAITAAAARLGDCRLIVIDPVSAYLKGIDDNRNAVLRGVDAPQQAGRAAGRRRRAGQPSDQGGSANGKHRVLGSIAYVGACRANHLFVTDPHDPTGRRVLMLDNGGNVAPPAPTLAYVIEDRGSGPRVEWSDQPVAITVEQALRPEAASVSRWRASGRTSRVRRLAAHFPRRRDSSPTIEVFKAGDAAGFSKDQIRRASSGSARSPARKASTGTLNGAGNYPLIPVLE